MSLEDERWRRERREIIRRHHPDHGGDPDVLVAELEALDLRQHQRPEVPVSQADGLTAQLRRGLRRVSRTTRRRVRVVRASVPRGWPGHRRYHDIST